MRTLRRRDFAKFAGLATLFSPFLSLLDSKPAHAAPGAAKYLCIFFTNGTDPALWTPRGSTESNLSFSEMMQPLEPLREDLVVIEKLDSAGSAGSHGAPGALTGFGHGQPIHISVDQFISDGLQAQGVNTQIPNLVLGGVTHEQPSTFYRSGQVLSPIASPSSAFQVVFDNAPPGGGGPPNDDAAQARLRRRESILDVVRGELQQLSQTLGSEERQKLDLHADSIRQLEERLQARADNGGGGNPALECGALQNPGNGSEDLLNSVLHLDLAINALACDLTRVASVQFGHHQSTQVSIPEVGAPGDWHNTFLHSDNPRTRLVELERWLSQQYVAAAEKMKSLPAPDGSGTLFDQTLFVWARDMGDAVVHDGSDMRFVFSGGAGGYLQKAPGGRYINGGGQRHLRALLNICEAMGVVNYTGFGDPNASGEAKTPLPSIGS